MMIYYYSITGDSTAIQIIPLLFVVFMIACMPKGCETLATGCKYAISNTVVDSITGLMFHVLLIFAIMVLGT